MRVYERLRKMEMYDEIDMRNNYRTGFWIGAVSGGLSMFLIAVLVGLFVTT